MTATEIPRAVIFLWIYLDYTGSYWLMKKNTSLKLYSLCIAGSCQHYQIAHSDMNNRSTILQNSLVMLLTFF